MLNKLFKEFLTLSSQLRPEYLVSLGKETNNWMKELSHIDNDTPELYKAIYGTVSGTKRSIKEQSLMDFIPGYRLIHIQELLQEKEKIENILGTDSLEGEKVFPILTNYSSDYVCNYRDQWGTEKICSLFHDDGTLIVMNNSPKRFLETICEFYKKKVYFLDQDGYLDYDMEKEAYLGSIFNPGVEYWLD